MALGDLFTTSVLPFLLSFVLIFAILQKSKILGEGNARIDAMISLAISLIVILTPTTRDLVSAFVPWIAVGAAALLVFFVLYGFVIGDMSNGKGLSKKVKIGFGVVIALFAIGVVIFTTGLDKTLFEAAGGIGSDIWSGAIMVAIIGAVFWVAISSGKNGGNKNEGGTTS